VVVMTLFMGDGVMWKWAVLPTLQRHMLPPSSGLEVIGMRIQYD
jgi:hypothetical protein